MEVVTNKTGETRLPLYRNRSFVLYFFTFLASSLSVAFFLFTVNWYVVDYLRLEAMLGLVFFASSIPRLLFMLIGGAIADRVNKATVMLLSDFTKAVLLILVIGLLIFDLVSIWVLVGLAFLFGLLDAFFWPASSSLFPKLVDREQLTRANSIVHTTQRFSVIAGPLIAGVVIGFGSYELMFGLVSLMLLLAAVVDLYLRKRVGLDEEEQQTHPSVWRSVMDGIRYVKESPFLLTLMLTSVSLNLFLSGPLQVGLPIFARNVIGGGEFTYSLLSGVLGAGMLIGAVLVGVINVNRRRGLVSLISIVALGVFMIAFSLTGELWVSLLVISLVGLTLSIIDVPILSAIQAHTDEKYIGRMMSLISFASMGLLPVSFLLTSVFISIGFSIDEIIFVASCCLLTVGLVVITFAKSIRYVD
ncbi:MFS transporter [Alkalibacillus haloalkaliphilus]|uniref:MFS transporter n=1 Tax=Alkalibacillus haloalkaliphilus TaxID=94136 RepID=UPI0029362F42|nr:MFS transporter [Alkalibacillus haloalkaliphilus]MDV2581300.1 MFS transporter [Alkalibacillus haloalkaliphilus]